MQNATLAASLTAANEQSPLIPQRGAAVTNHPTLPRASTNAPRLPTQPAITRHLSVGERFSATLGYRPLHLPVGMTQTLSPTVISLPPHNPTLTPVQSRRRASTVPPTIDLDHGNTTAPLQTRTYKVESDDDYDDQSDDETDEQGKSHRTVSLSAGSIKASIFNLCSATLGAGTLSLPYAFSRVGIVVGILLLVSAAVISVFSIRLLLKCRQWTLLSSYEDLSFHCFGHRITVLVEVIILLFCFGTAAAYIVAVGDIVTPILSQTFSIILTKYFVMCIFTLCIMLPLSLSTEVNNLRYSSMIGVLAILVLVIVVTIRSIQYNFIINNIFLNNNNINIFNYSQIYITDIFIAIPIILFAFTCHVNIFSIYTELQRPSIRRMNKVIYRSFYLNLIIYLIIALFGYLHHNIHTQPDILNNMNNTILVDILAKISVGLSVSLAFPLNVLPARQTLEIMLYANETFSTIRSYVLSIIIVLSALSIACFVPAIDTLFALLGSISSSLVCFVLPAAFYLHLSAVEHDERAVVVKRDLIDATLHRVSSSNSSSVTTTSWWRLNDPDWIGAVILLISGSAIGVISTAVSIQQIIYTS